MPGMRAAPRRSPRRARRRSPPVAGRSRRRGLADGESVAARTRARQSAAHRRGGRPAGHGRYSKAATRPAGRGRREERQGGVPRPARSAAISRTRSAAATACTRSTSNAEVAAIRDAVGKDFFINARTDLFLHAKPEAHAGLIDAALERAASLCPGRRERGLFARLAKGEGADREVTAAQPAAGDEHHGVTSAAPSAAAGRARRGADQPRPAARGASRCRRSRKRRRQVYVRRLNSQGLRRMRGPDLSTFGGTSPPPAG